jgi:hypothetical protein
MTTIDILAIVCRKFKRRDGPFIRKRLEHCEEDKLQMPFPEQPANASRCFKLYH